MNQPQSTTTVTTEQNGTTVTRTVTRHPLPAPLEPEVLRQRVDQLVAMIRSEGCTDLAVTLANSIADSRGTGRALNVHRALRQMTLPSDPDGSINFDSRLDLDGRNGIEHHELSGVLLAAAEIAARHNIQVSQVPLNEDFVNLARECAQRVLNSNGTCRN